MSPCKILKISCMSMKISLIEKINFVEINGSLKILMHQAVNQTKQKHFKIETTKKPKKSTNFFRICKKLKFN